MGMPCFWAKVTPACPATKGLWTWTTSAWIMFKRFWQWMSSTGMPTL